MTKKYLQGRIIHEAGEAEVSADSKICIDSCSLLVLDLNFCKLYVGLQQFIFFCSLHSQAICTSTFKIVRCTCLPLLFKQR